MVRLMAWESANYAWNSFAHSLGAFVVSSGFAGLAAVLAAGLAAWQVSKTRRDERLKRDLESVQKRFEWVVERSTPPTGRHAPDKSSVLTSAQTAAMLRSIRSRAQALGDDLLTDIIRTYRTDKVVDLLWEDAPDRRSW
jgi:hypothetical protein